MSKRTTCDGGGVDDDETPVAKQPPTAASPAPTTPPSPTVPASVPVYVSEERRCAEALMLACDERLGAQSPAALMVCDTYLARDFWTNFAHQGYLPPAAHGVWAWGANRARQLGLGDAEKRTTPTEVTALRGRRIHAVACGLFHAMVVVDDGELWTAGNNGDGELGLGDFHDRSTFTRVLSLSRRKVIAVACGFFHTLAVLETGELFAWGSNTFGQLGLGDTTDRPTPVPVTALRGMCIAAIACEESRSVAVLETGELFVWGDNGHGQLGLDDDTNRNVPTQLAVLAGEHAVAVACSGACTAAVTESGDLFTWGHNLGFLGSDDLTDGKNTPQLVEDFRGRPVAAVACGIHHVLFGVGEVSADPVSTPQRVHFFDDKRVKSIHCGAFFSGAVLESGELFMWGLNHYWQLGTGDCKARSTPTQVAGLADKHVLSVSLGVEHTIALIQ